MKKIVSLVLGLSLMTVSVPTVWASDATEQEIGALTETPVIEELTEAAEQSEYLFNVNFADYYDSEAESNVYTAEQLKAKDSELNITAEEQVQFEIDADGKAKLFATPSLNPWFMHTQVGMSFPMPEGITTGFYQFEIKFEGSSIKYSDKNSGKCRFVFGLDRTLDAGQQVLCLPKNGSGIIAAGGGAFTNGEADYAPQGTGPYELVIQVRRLRDDSDWNVKVFDKAVSSEQPIYSTTVAKEDAPNLDNVGMTWWNGIPNNVVSMYVYSFSAKELEIEKTKVASTSLSEGIGVVSPTAEVTFSSSVDESTISEIEFISSSNINMVKDISLKNGGITAELSLEDLNSGEVYTLNVPETVYDTDGRAIEAYSEQVTADAENDVIINFDLKDYYDENGSNVYTVAQLKELGAPVFGSSDVLVGISQNGQGTIYSEKSSSANLNFGYTLPEITSGTVEFNMDYGNFIQCTAGGEAINNTIRNLFTINTDNGIGGASTVIAVSKYSGTGLLALVPFENGAASYTSNPYSLKIVVSSPDDTSDWTAICYDNNKPSGGPVLIYKIPRNKAPNLNKVGMAFYHVNSNTVQLFLKSVKVSYKKDKNAELTYEVMPDSDISLAFPSELANESLDGSEITLKDKSGNEIKADLSLDGNSVVITPKKYLKYGEDYSISVTGIHDFDGDWYETELAFKTVERELKVTNIIENYYTASGTSTDELVNAAMAKGNVTINNSSGEDKQVYAVCAVYNEDGKLENCGTSGVFTISSGTHEIFAEVNLLETSAHTVVTSVFEVRSGNVVKIN